MNKQEQEGNEQQKKEQTAGRMVERLTAIEPAEYAPAEAAVLAATAAEASWSASQMEAAVRHSATCSCAACT